MNSPLTVPETQAGTSYLFEKHRAAGRLIYPQETIHCPGTLPKCSARRLLQDLKDGMGSSDVPRLFAN